VPQHIPDRPAVEVGQEEGSAAKPRPAVWIRPTAVYCTLVFVVTWSFCVYAWLAKDTHWRFDVGIFHFDLTRSWAISTVGGFAPGAVALFLGLFTQWQYFPSPLSQLRSPIRPKGLYFISVSAPILICLLGLVVQENRGLDAIPSSDFMKLVDFFALLLLTLPLAPLWEELGWRGCLLPLLSSRFGLWTASLIVGVIWAAWHIPAYLLLSGTSVSHYLAFCALVVGMSVVIAAMYRAGGSSLRLPILYHAVWNATAGSLTEAGFSLRAVGSMAAATWVLALFCWLWWSGQESEISSSPAA
jgi:membrane protease YdiL (CAAX protease family)